MAFGGNGAITLTIANGAAISDAASIGGGRALGIILPALDAGVITFQVSADDSTYVEAKKSSDGTAVTIPTGTHNCAYDLPLELLSFAFIKVRTGTAASPVTQSSARTIYLTRG